MSLSPLAKPEWRSFFDAVSPSLRASVVEVEVSGLGLEARIARDWARLAALSYSEHNDILEISVHGADLAIRRPARIHLRRDGPWLQSVEILDSEGNHAFVIFKEPLRLPQPSAALPRANGA